MEYRSWLFVAALAGLTAVLAGALGAHGLVAKNPVISAAMPIYNAGQLYHALHALALLGVALLFGLSEGRRCRFGTVTLRLAAIAFTGGILLFSGGIYVQTIERINVGGMVPAGGLLFLAGWAALALSAFGLRGAGERSGS